MFRGVGGENPWAFNKLLVNENDFCFVGMATDSFLVDVLVQQAKPTKYNIM